MSQNHPVLGEDVMVCLSTIPILRVDCYSMSQQHSNIEDGCHGMSQSHPNTESGFGKPKIIEQKRLSLKPRTLKWVQI